MKKHIKTYLSIILVLSMLLLMLPIYAAATDDEFEGLEIVEEIPFEFELEPGDLPLDMLADAVLPAADLPAYISASLAAERDHVNRLYLQEPDANTVMFQNRDGSKTIYVFSKPVKDTGLTLGTNALAVSGGKIAFSGNNIITNRIGLNAAGKQIQDYKIGYSDIQTLTGGVLTANGIDITEDVRNWAVSEFGAADAEYTISDSASAAYIASVSLTETEPASNAGASASANAVTPGITITPINPSPATGATVMSITYADLAGKMCFKNAETNTYLTLHPTTKNSLITTNNIYGTFSYWIVKYVAVGQYTICSYYDRTNKYIGVYYEDLALVLGTLNNLGEDAIFEISITSFVNSTIEIKPYYESDHAISSNLGLVHGDESDEFPDSCTWIITNRSDYVELQSITPQSTTRIEEAGDYFDAEYTTVPSNATDTDIRMYYADTNQEFVAEDDMSYYITTPGNYTFYYKDIYTGVRSANFTINVVRYVTSITVSVTTRIEQSEVGFDASYTALPTGQKLQDIRLYIDDSNAEQPDSEVGKNSAGRYVISTPGVYTVYYKDAFTGVRSGDFLLIIVDSIESYEPNITYSIRQYDVPENSADLYITVNSSSGLCIDTKHLEDRTVKRSSGNATIKCERLANVSRTFTFKHASDTNNILSGTYITATMSTSQYTGLPDRESVYGNEFSANYYLTNKNNVANTLNYNTDETDDISDGLGLIDLNSGGTPFVILDMGDYYIIAVAQYLNASQPTIKALKASGSSFAVADYLPNATDADSFKWCIDQVGVDAPLMKQTGSVWCGPTSYLQVLLGKSEDVVGDRYDTILNVQQSTIKSTFTDFVEGSGVITNTFYSKINSGGYLLPGYTCSELEITNDVTNDFIKRKITSSLDSGMACMFITSTGRAPYRYDYDSDSAHIICIVGYDEVSDTVLISNCHYWDTTDPDYDTTNVFGIYEIDFSNFCYDVGRLWYFTYTQP